MQGTALRIQGFAPSALMGSLLGLAGVSLRPGSKGVSYPEGRRAAACVSLDFDVTKESRREANRGGTRLLQGLAERYEIPLTWAICGMTAQEEPSLLEAVLGSSVEHEVAFHTYSHIRVDLVTPSQLEEDYHRWRNVMGEVVPKTIVFPYNKEGNFETIRKLGFTTFRGEERRVGPPFVDKGSWNISPVLYLSGRSEGTVSTAKMFIDLCARYRSVFHLWSHPWNLSREGDPERFARDVLEPIFAYLSEKRQAGALNLNTMVQLSEFSRSVGQVPPN